MHKSFKKLKTNVLYHISRAVHRTQELSTFPQGYSHVQVETRNAALITAPTKLIPILNCAAAFLLLSGLVLPNSLWELPPLPFEVDSAAGSTVAVLRVRVNAVVANVVLGAATLSVAEVKNTSAAPGAGTVTTHVLLLDPATGEHVIVSTTSLPTGRPSDSKILPKV